jgi:hypothetical protein
VAAAAPALDRISHGVDFDITPIETALNWSVHETPRLQAMWAGKDSLSNFEHPHKN